MSKQNLSYNVSTEKSNKAYPEKEREKVENKNENKQEEELDEFTKLRKRRAQCQKVWEESWDKKLNEEECMEDYKACCAPNDFFKKPKVQSNIWVRVKHEKNTQHVYMAFM
jgi:uncharacterized membrane-anchored protein